MYVSGTYYPAAGGAEISMHTFLKGAVRRGYDTLVATSLEQKGSAVCSLEYDGVKIININHNTREEELSKIVDSYKPELLITQLMWSDIALKVANERKIKSILRFCKIPAYLDISEGSEFSPTSILVVSDYVRDYVMKNWNRQSIVIHPPIETENVISQGEDRIYITMFNPNIKKGGDFFREIALRMGNHYFATVSGWDILKNGDKTDTEIIRRLCESLRIKYTGQKLDDISFDGVKNVKKFSYTSDVSKIYAKTRVLCIPSQWQEAFGRVSIEAMVNSIPVVGSNVGGLAEIVRGGGVLINNSKDPDEWVQELRKLDDTEEYERIAKKGKLYVEHNYDYNAICNKFFEVINN
ncbi:MAG: glycosyltransferase family 4 protein [Nanoarchaeota archaeon]|nr:glycosyltransferase family 4 protein [Nanoarchaeota archaeon]